MKRKNIKKKLKKYRWIIILAITVFTAMWIYGNATHYFPEPIMWIEGQYLDISTGVVILGVLLSGYIVAFIFKKDKKKRRK